MVAVVVGATEPRAMEQRAHLPALLRPKGNVAEAAVAVANRVWRGGPTRRRGGAAETIGLLCWKSSQFTVVPPSPLWLLYGSFLTMTPQASCSRVRGFRGLSHLHRGAPNYVSGTRDVLQFGSSRVISCTLWLL